MLLLFAACSSLLTIEIEDSTTTTVEGGTLVESLLGDLGFDGFLSMNLMESEELKNQGVEPGDISQAKLTLLEMTVTDPADGDLSFIDQLDLYVSAPDVERQLIATQDDFPASVQMVSFERTDVDLTPYIVSESLSLTTDVTASRPAVDTTIEARYIIEVTATLQGVKNQAD